MMIGFEFLDDSVEARADHGRVGEGAAIGLLRTVRKGDLSPRVRTLRTCAEWLYGGVSLKHISVGVHEWFSRWGEATRRRAGRRF